MRDYNINEEDLQTRRTDCEECIYLVRLVADRSGLVYIEKPSSLSCYSLVPLYDGELVLLKDSQPHSSK